MELEKTEKELDLLYFKSRIKLFNTDILCKLFYNKSIKDGKKNNFKNWKNATFENKNKIDTFSQLTNSRNILLQDKSHLDSSLIEYKLQYERVNEEFHEFKKIFCKNCLQDDNLNDIDDSNIIAKIQNDNYGTNISKSNEFSKILSFNFFLDVSNEDGDFMEPNKMVGNDPKLHEDSTKNNNELKNKIVIIENRINTLKVEYDQKVNSNEKFLKIYEEKKKVNF